jgi:predicted ATPase/signal transduction histidine kinase
MTRAVYGEEVTASTRSSSRRRSPPAPLEVTQLRPLRRKERAVLYRGRAAAGEPVIVEILVAPRASDFERLTHEYELTHEHRSAAVLRARCLTVHEGRPALVFEDFAGTPLVIRAPLAAREFLRIAERIAAAVSEIHRDGVVHKDLKPENILVESSTGAVKLTGFGLAVHLPLQPGDARAAGLEGSLPYMSPEQTGRMNRSVDGRSDLYSLGVVFFEMLTGRLPFDGADALEWIHSHVARPPPSPRSFEPSIAEPLATITLKLLAKAAEDRYQTAGGLVEDLARCRAQLLETGQIVSFPLATEDVSDSLQLPQRLYGRSRELARLEGALARVVSSGRPELVLVSGYAGVGKSTLVHELVRSVAGLHGLFLCGKCEQFGAPTLVVAQAFRVPVRELLGAGQRELDASRERLAQAIGPNARLVTEVVPELALVLGPQAELPALGPNEDEHRFQGAFTRFAAAFAGPARPLVVFLDDLQWADRASVRLVLHLVTALAAPVLIIGAYRDNELEARHPLLRAADELRSSEHFVEHLTVGPLLLEDLTALLADTLQQRCNAGLVRLAELLLTKTGGNPLFVIQLLRELARRGLLRFDHVAKNWTWDLERIARERYSDNVVDLMVKRLRQLPRRTLEILQLASVFGSTVGERLLSGISRRSAQMVHRDLHAALREGLLARGGDAYRFAHDRVQQAAYSLIPEMERPSHHARIGRLLLSDTPAAEVPERIFEIVNQLEAGRVELSDEEKDVLAELSLVAGRKARGAAAYDVASRYLTVGVSLLRPDVWEGPRADLAFALNLEHAQSEMLAGRCEEPRRLLQSLEARVQTKRQRADVARLATMLAMVSGDVPKAIAICLAALQHFGIAWTSQPIWEEVHRDFERLEALLGGRAIEELAELPAMVDPDVIALMDILTVLKAPAAHTEPTLFCLVACRMVTTSLVHGNASSSGFGYVLFGMVVAHFFDRWDEASHWARLASEVAARHTPLSDQGRIQMGVAASGVWSRPARENRVLFERALELNQQTGDIGHTAFCYLELIALLLFQGVPLTEVTAVSEEAARWVRGVGFPLAELSVGGQRSLVREMTGAPPPDPDEGKLLGLLEAHRSSFAVAILWRELSTLIGKTLLGEPALALEAAAKARDALWASPALVSLVQFHFFEALAHAASCDAVASAEERDVHIAVVRGAVERFQAWSKRCPENFSDKHALLVAELARLEGRDGEAERFYERAVAAATEQELQVTVALGLELAGRHYLRRGLERVAESYLADARDAYDRWGATRKVAMLEARYPRIVKPTADARGSVAARTEQLDLLSVMKATQNIAQETDGSALVRTLMRVAIEQSVAERGYLLLADGGPPRIMAAAHSSEEGVTATVLSASSDPSRLVPEPLVNYVWRSREQVVIADASARLEERIPANENNARMIPDEYVARVRPRSVLCRPILRRGEVVGALYLENNLIAGAFTPERVAALDVITTQAAISLEVASLLEQERQARAAAEAALQAREEFMALAAHELRTPLTPLKLQLQLLQGLVANERGAVSSVGDRSRGTLVSLFQSADQQIDRLTRLVGDLLELSVVDAGRLSLQVRDVDLTEIARSVVERLQASAKSSLSVELQAPEPVRGLWDPARIEQVLENLLANAVKYGEGRPVEVGVRAKDGHAFVSVRDRGLGIGEEDQARIFDRFARAVSVTHFGGFGLGLYIAREIARAHGGTIEVTSRLGDGATFTVDLPLSPPAP